MRFRPRFSISDLLLLSAIVGMATGWWLDHRRLAFDYQKAVDREARSAKELDESEGHLRAKIGELAAERHKSHSFQESYQNAQFNKAAHDPIDGPALWDILKRYGFYKEQFNLGQRQ